MSIKMTQQKIEQGGQNILTDLSAPFLKLQEGVVEWTAYDLLKYCPSLAQVVKTVEVLAKIDATVLLLGESGTGKDLAAESLHQLSPRVGFPFRKISCASLSEDFFHNGGAGVLSLQAGLELFQDTTGGTVLLDNVAELSFSGQTLILQALEAMERGVGHAFGRPDVRLLATSRVDLVPLVREGRFSEELFYRLGTCPLSLPPLRERREDIIPLARLLYSRLALVYGLEPPPLLMAADLGELCFQPWPGNVRQLRYVLERSLLDAAVRKSVNMDVSWALHEADAIPSAFEDYMKGACLEEAGARAIIVALKESRGRIQGPHGAATALGLAPNTLRAKMKKLGIPLPSDLRKSSAQDENSHEKW